MAQGYASAASNFFIGRRTSARVVGNDFGTRLKILLLDEPTTYLDIAHQLEVMDIIADVNKKFSTTIVMVLHDINHARLYSDEILIVKDKKIFLSNAAEIFFAVYENFM